MIINSSTLRICAVKSGEAYRENVKPTISCKETDTEVYITQKDQDLYVAFRGTEDHNDMLTDISFGLKKSYGEAEVHRGFEESIKSVRDQIGKYLYNRPHSGLYLTGHSLGGALAVLMAKNLRFKELRKLKGVITFGAPKVGDKRFCDSYNSIVERAKVTQRIVYAADVVPNLPPDFLGFRHTTGATYIEANGLVHQEIGYWKQLWLRTKGRFTNPLSTSLVSHSIARYIAAIRSIRFK